MPLLVASLAIVDQSRDALLMHMSEHSEPLKELAQLKGSLEVLTDHGHHREGLFGI